MIQRPLYVFPIGGRGDFLLSILHGNVLKNDWDQKIVSQPLTLPMENYPIKIHNFGKNLAWFSGLHEINSADIKNYFSIRISVTNQEELFQIAYLASIKRNDGESLTVELLTSRVFMTMWQEEEFAKYNDQFRYIIPFGQLFDVNFIQDLYKEINNKTLTHEQLFRINYNIELNQNLLKTNPYVLTLDNNVMEKS